ncbi:hypothetical protein E2C01_070712 [Portunus trituberculatus]|uniref:Uncharacterized protein n=1 Tax=Portunus trituberculatus TaxID=210409 RepID=A0A5B7HY17_PORTR|nr:hypothetical protein [Portunus trituberculatus]
MVVISGNSTTTTTTTTISTSTTSTTTTVQSEAAVLGRRVLEIRRVRACVCACGSACVSLPSRTLTANTPASLCPCAPSMPPPLSCRRRGRR